jgi:hypothetical protein
MRTSLWLIALAMLLLGEPLITQPSTPTRLLVGLPFILGFILAFAGDVQELRSGRQ